MSAPSASYVDMGNYLVQLMKDNQVDLTLADVFYGDQSNIPRTPTACMDPGGKNRELNGAPRRSLVTITNYIIVYHNKMQGTEKIRLEDDQRAEAIEALIHTDSTMGGLVIDSMVTGIESGYLMRERTMFRASRLTVEARVQEMLPYG